MAFKDVIKFGTGAAFSKREPKPGEVGPRELALLTARRNAALAAKRERAKKIEAAKQRGMSRIGGWHRPAT